MCHDLVLIDAHHIHIFNISQPIGAMAAEVPSLQPNEVFRHTAGFVCLSRGRFILSYVCETRRGDVRSDDVSESKHHWGVSIGLMVQ